MNTPLEMKSIVCMLDELNQEHNNKLVHAAVNNYQELYANRLHNQSKKSAVTGGAVLLAGIAVVPVVPIVGLLTFYTGYFKFFGGAVKTELREIAIIGRASSAGRELTGAQVLCKMMQTSGGDDENSGRYLFVMCCLGMQKYYLHHALGLKVDGSTDAEWINIYASELHELLKASHITTQEIVYFFSGNKPAITWDVINGETLEKIYTTAAQRYLTESRPLEVLASLRFNARVENLRQRISGNILFPDPTNKPQEVVVRIDPCLHGNTTGCLEHLLQQLRCTQGNQDSSSLKGFIVSELCKLPEFQAALQMNVTVSELSMILAKHLYGSNGLKPVQLPDSLPFIATLIPELTAMRLQDADLASTVSTYNNHNDYAHHRVSAERESWWSIKN